MNNYTICLLIGSIALLLLIGILFYKTGFTVTKGIVFIIIAIVLSLLIYLSNITNFFTEWDVDIFKILVSKDEIIF